MVFTMPASAIVKYWWQLCVLIVFSTAVYAGTFIVQSAQVSKIGNGYVLSATVKYPLTPRVKEALENGVPIVFSQQFELIKNTSILGEYWQWQDTLWATELRYELRYHALSQQYVLQTIDTGHQRNFLSLEGALQSLGNIEKLSLPPEHLTDSDNLILRLRSGIDLHALPTVMRPGALVSTKWQLTSPWMEAQWY